VASIATTSNTVINDHTFLDILLLLRDFFESFSELDVEMNGGERLTSFPSGYETHR
jgi:hypothetical protein